MRYFGKIAGYSIGYLAGGIVGCIIGLLLGHLFDINRGKLRFSSFFQASNQSKQALFFCTTFEVMGYLSKSKGRVTETDIHMASLFMQRLSLYGEAREAAQRAFRNGKSSDYPLREKLAEFRRAYFYRRDLLRIFLDIQIQMAFSDGFPSSQEQNVLHIVAEELGVSRLQFEAYIRNMGGYHASTDNGQYQYNGQKAQTTIHDACAILGVAINDSPLVIKRAYRKMMAEHHPDKLVAKGLPKEMLELAKQQTQKIQQAYEMIKQAKKFK